MAKPKKEERILDEIASELVAIPDFSTPLLTEIRDSLKGINENLQWFRTKAELANAFGR